MNGFGSKFYERTGPPLVPCVQIGMGVQTGRQKAGVIELLSVTIR